MARLAHQFAVESRLVASEVVAAEDFPELARTHRVTSVPHLLVDGSRSLVGSLRAPDLLKALFE